MSTADIVAELEPLVRRLTADDYYALYEAGLLEDQKVELLRGVIVEMSPTNPPHHQVVQWLTNWIARRLPEHLHIRPQSPWSAADDSEPEPDLVIVRAGWYREEPVTRSPREAELIIEVAWSSLRRDLHIKAGIYAEAGVAEYWVVDVDAWEVVVHTDPADGAYTSVRRAAPPEVLTTCGVEVPLAELVEFSRP